MSNQTHYACAIEHPRRRGRQWPGSHGPGCAVAVGHTPRVSARTTDCSACKRERTLLETNADITGSEYVALLEAQKGVCAICGNHQGFALAVDHDHLTGRIRGLLCRNCNQGLGYFGDDPERMLRAIAYVKRP